MGRALVEADAVNRWRITQVTDLSYTYMALESTTRMKLLLGVQNQSFFFCEKLLARGGSNEERTEELEMLGVVCKYFIHIDHFSLGRRLHSVDWGQERRMLKMVRELLFGGEQEFSSSLDNMEFFLQS